MGWSRSRGAADWTEFLLAPDSGPAILIGRRPHKSQAMTWVTRRIAGAIVFAIATGILGTFAIVIGFLAGPPTVFTSRGLLILAIAFLISLGVTTSMKSKESAQKAWEDNIRAWQRYNEANNRAWQAYYARMYNYRAWQAYYAGMNSQTITRAQPQRREP